MIRSLFVVVTLALSAALASAATYEKNAFTKMQKAGKASIVIVAADWCPTCKAQDAALADLLKQPAFASVTPVRVDFDKQKDAVKSLSAKSQSTLIVFKGDKEVGRAVGETRPEELAALIRKAL